MMMENLLLTESLSSHLTKKFLSKLFSTKLAIPFLFYGVFTAAGKRQG